MKEQTITFYDVPGSNPAELARLGEEMGTCANGEDDPHHPGPRAWIKAGIAASAILRHTHRGQMSAALLVALIADAVEPRSDDCTPQRKAIIDGYRSVIVPAVSG